MTQTTHLALPLIDAAQAQKHVTHNEALALLDALAHLAVSARNVTSPPTSPSEGDRVLVGAGAADAFAGKDGQIATFLAGGWTFLQPQAGWRLYVAAESLLLLHVAGGWVDLGACLRELQNLSRLGIGTTADATNPLSAKLNAALFAARAAAEGGSGDLRLSLNKESAGKTVSQLYQSNYSGRAETGLTGDDDFRVKVSADGANWRDGIVVDRHTGAVSFPSGGPAKVRTFTASGAYTPTPGMRFVDVALFGAGGGGGSGARQAAGAAASGGGGGGGGGIARGRFTAAQIGASRMVTVGAGGAGGAAQTVNSTGGNAGAAGGDTTFGALMTAFGGGAGAGGGLAAASGGGGGSSQFTKGSNGAGASGGIGSQGLGPGGSGAAGGGILTPSFGSGGGGAPAAGTAGAQGGNAVFGATGGGAGGGVASSGAASNGGTGGYIFVNGAAITGAPGVAGGAINGGAGPGNFVNGSGPLEQAGAGGGGGASGLASAGAGGAGGFPGGGGGGGGAHQNGGSGGAGGAGAAGYAVIVEYF